MSVFESLSEVQRELIVKHLQLVIEANKRVNLTRIDSLEEGMTLHVEDSLSGLEELNAAPHGLYGDLGTGGGFPGIPLAIATGRETTLIDTRMKKVEILEDIVEELGLNKQVHGYAGRAELLAKTQSKRYAALTARALAKLATLMELASPLLKKGGRLICYKAQMEDAELAHARRVQPLVGMTLVSDRQFRLNGEYTRRILVFEKIDEPKVKLPRQEGMAQKNPLLS